MNNFDNNSGNNPFNTEDIINQSLTVPLGEENPSLGLEIEGAYQAPITKEIEPLAFTEESTFSEENTSLRDFDVQPASFLSTDSIENIDALTGAVVENNTGLEEIEPVSPPIPAPERVISLPSTEGNTVTFSIVSRNAGYKNEIGFFRVDDQTGRIGEYTPSDAGYAAAALDESRRLGTLQHQEKSVTAHVNSGGFIGSYLIQNSTSEKFLKQNPQNQLNQKPLAFFSFAEANPDEFNHLQSQSSGEGEIELVWEDLTGAGDRDYNDAIVAISFNNGEPISPPIKESNFAVIAEGKINIKGQADFDGEPTDVNDDALIYAGKGFNISGNSVLPVVRDEGGNPLVDSDNKQLLVDNAMAVGVDYESATAANSEKIYSGLIPPQIVENQTVEISDYATIKQETLDNAITDNSQIVDFDVARHKLKNQSQWNDNFPSPGTVDNPTIIRAVNGNLSIPSGVDLSNYVIIVEDGDIKFQGEAHNLDNVVLVAETGAIELDKVVANNSTFLASKTINIKSDNTFTGENLIANGEGNIEFKGETFTVNPEARLTIQAAFDLNVKGNGEFRGRFLAHRNFNVRGDATFYGEIGAKQDINFNGQIQVFARTTEINLPQVSVESVTVTEGNEENTASVTVSLSHASATAVSVDYSTVGDTATKETDYQAQTGTLTFSPGETSLTIDIAIVGDNLNEAEEVFLVQLSNPVGAVVVDEIGTVNIIDDDDAPEIGIDSVNSVEKEESDSNSVSFTVSLSTASSLPVTVDYATIDDLPRDGGTALAGVDYVATSGTLTFSPGETSKTIIVEILGDNRNELEETFQIELSNPSNASIGDNNIGTGTISDNDEPPTISLSDVNISEGDEVGTFTVSLSAASSLPVTVDYATADDTAVAPKDYQTTTGSLTFAPGETEKNISVPILDNSLDQVDRKFSIQLNNANNASLADPEGIGSIVDDDEPPTVSIDTTKVDEGNGETKLVALTVQLSQASSLPISVDFATEDKEAVEGLDYEAVSGTLTFSPGETSKTITVPILSDGLDEIDEAFVLRLNNPTHVTITQEVQEILIADSDESPSLVIDEITLDEGNEGTTDAVFTLNLSAASSLPITVEYVTSDGTAIAGLDYQAVSGTLTFSPGETSKTITVPILSDSLDEIDEAFTLKLEKVTNANPIESQVSATITDDDAPPKISVDSVTVTETDTAETEVTFTLNLSAPSSLPITVDYATAEDTALAGVDYTAISGTLTFSPGETSLTATVLVKGDLLDESDETFAFNLTNPTNATVDTQRAIATIVDNDAPPVAAIDSISITETDEGTTNAVFTVSLDNPSQKTITIDYATVDDLPRDGGTAIAGLDYQAVSGTLTFSPGETSKTISVPIIGDKIDELDEAFKVNLSNPQFVTLSEDQATGTGTIEDNDAPPVAAIDNVSIEETDEGTVNAVFEVSLDNPSQKTITIDYATIDDLSSNGGMAIAGEDYVATSGTLTFSPGETTKKIEIPILGDTLDELDEAFKVNLSNPQFVTLSEDQATATGTIEDNDVPVLTVELANDTGDGRDNLTNNPTINGTIENVSEDITLTVSLAGSSEEIDISDKVGEDGSFSLDLAELTDINGGSFDDGTYTVNVTATHNPTGNSTNSSLTFTFDTTAPELSLLTPITNAQHSDTARLIGDVSETATIEYVLDGVETNTVKTNENNHFDVALRDSAIAAGTHGVKIIVTDGAGNITETEVNFEVKPEEFSIVNERDSWGVKNNALVMLGERDGLVTETAIPIELGQTSGSRTLKFELAPLFDTTDTAPILEDQLLVYLVDPNDPTQTLLDNGESGTAVFSLAGENADFTPGRVRFDGQTVEIDLTSLADKTEGLLVFQLLNQDGDTGSIVTAANFSNLVDETGGESPLFPDSTILANPGTEMDLTGLNATDSVAVQLSNVRFDKETGEYTAKLQVENTGEAVNRQIAVVFPDLPAGVELKNASGVDEAGNPYINLYNAILPGGLDKGAISDAIEITFENPQLLNFSLTPQVLSGGANQAPIFEPIAPITVMPGGKIAIDLEASDPDGDTVNFLFEADGELPTGTLEGNGKLIFNPSPDEIGSYQFTLIATDGFAETRQNVTLNVVADPVITTRISGVIQNVQQEPLAGVPIELGDLQTVTNANGEFVIETDQPLTADTLVVRGEEITGDAVYPYIAEKLPLVLGQEVYEGFNNIIDRPIYLPALDVASGQVIDPSVDNTITTENIPGASVFVEAGSLMNQEGEPFTGTLSITEVPIDLTPAALPENLVPDMVVTIQPGEMEFTTPAPLSLPNQAGYEPGIEMNLWSINPETGNFDNVGTGVVSDDGSVIETVEGGIRNSSWHFFVPTPPFVPDTTDLDDSEDIEENLDEKCNACQDGISINSEVKSHSGALIETHELTTYQSNGVSRGITLTYDSLRADPRHIVHFGFSNIRTVSDLYLLGGITINNGGFNFRSPGVSSNSFGGVTTGQNLWRIPEGSRSIYTSLQVDLSNLPSGVHQYTTNAGLRRWWRSQNRFVGSSTTRSSNELLSVNSVNSPFGSGWGISGWQEIVENRNGSILLIDGDGEEVVFEAPPNGRGSIYTSPADDFSTLEKLADGTFRRTMKDQTVYRFNQNNQLTSITDRNGNKTEYVYENGTKLTKIIDPVGLETIFTYNELGKVSKITDPANRETLLQYDTAGNLISIADPDESTRTWGYDSKHHMIAETDKKGNRETTTYNFAGRVIQGTRKDGTEIRVSSLQSRGLSRTEATTDPLSSAEARSSRGNISSSYADGNGNVTETRLDRAGQAISSRDGEGNRTSVQRNEQNLVKVSTDARGNKTEYTYDSRGNVVNIVQPLSQIEKIQTDSEIFTQVNYPTGSSPQTLTASDFNLDGNNDLITFNGNNTFSLLYGDTEDIFLNKKNYSIPGNADSSFFADLNEDGLTEVVTVINGNLALRSGGESGFNEPEIYNPISLDNTEEISFTQPNYIPAANLDFLVDTSQFDFLNLVSISGNKPFKQPDYINVGEPQPTTLLAQLNADEIQDRITLNDDDTFSIEIGKEDGTFESAVNYDFNLDYMGGIGEYVPGSALITAGDMNNDGNEDILVAFQKTIIDETQPVGSQETVNSYLNVLSGRGDGTVSVLFYYQSLFDEPYGYPESFVLKDIENDGILDWIAFDRDNLEIRPIRYNLETSQLFWFKPRLSTDPEYLAVGDFVDRYLSQDIIAADATKTQLELVSYFTRNNDFDIFRVYDPDSRASARRSTHTLTNSSDYIAVEDLDGNNRFDWITVSEDRSQVNIYLKNFDGSNKSEDTITFENIPSSVNLGDLDEDGNYDLLAVYEETGDFFAYFGNGDGTFANPVTYNLPGEYDTPILRDLDSDGDEDLIAVATDDSGSKTFSVFLDDGTGNYAEPFSYTFNDNPNSFVLKDLDGDGDEDLVAVNSLSKRLTVVTNENNTGLANEASYNLTDFDYLSFQDLDSDGDLDLLTSTENQKSFSILFNQGDASFNSPLSFNFNDSVQRLAFKDLDGDNNLDLVGTFDTAQQELFVALGKADGSYGATTNYSFSTTPDRLSYQDVDGNGVTDLIATNLAKKEISVFLTTESVTNGVVSNSTIKRTYTTSLNPERVGLLDIDFDNDLDLVVTNAEQTAYSIRLNNNYNTFGSEYTTTTNLTTTPAHLTLTDIDGKNGLDLLAANEDKTQYSLLFNNGFNNGSFTFGAETNFNFQTSLNYQTWRDFNSDGIKDFISTNEERSSISVFLGKDDGSFESEIVYNLTSNPTSIVLGDLDGNNSPDLIGINADKSQVTTIKSNPDGTLQPEVTYTPGIESVNTLSIDVDGDGDEDHVIANVEGNTVTVSLNRGDDTFDPGAAYLVGNKPIAVVAQDANHDGYLDLITANQNSNNISILYGIGNGLFANSLKDEAATAINGSNGAYDTKLFDLNNDSYLDLITVDYNRDRISVLLGTENGDFAGETSYGVGNAPYSVVAEDVNGDNIADLITANSNDGTVSVLLGLGNGSFETAVHYEAGNKPYGLAADDFNDDGIRDLVVTNYDNRTVSILLGNGDGSFANPSSYFLSESYPTDVEIGDFNNDGIKDLVTSHYYGGLSILLGNSNGSFIDSTSHYVNPYLYDVNSYLYDVEVADFNEDGLSDLVTTRYGKVSILYSNENGIFASRKDYITGSYFIPRSSNYFIPRSVKADLNGDNLPEIITTAQGNNFSILRNKGNQSFVLEPQLKIGGLSVGFAVGDLDDNETDDLLVISYSSDGKSLEVTNIISSLLGDRFFKYEPTFNQLTRYTDELGRKTFNEIDPNNGNILSTTQVVGKTGGDDDVTTTYTYTDAGLVDTMTDPEGRVMDYNYDEYGRLIEEISAKGTPEETVVRYEYDTAGNQTAIIDAQGNRTEFEYDALNRVTKITEADPDEDGELTSPVSTFTYDEAGNLIETVDANENVTKSEYDKLNRLISTTDAEGEKSEFEYDGAGNIVTVTDAEGRESQNVYDTRNRLIEIIDPLGNSTKYEYDADDNLTAKLAPLGNKTQYVYDQRGRLIKEIDAEGNITKYEYDVSDNLIAVIDANGNRTEFEYDDLERQIGRVNALGDIFSTSYDKVGNIISTTDELGRTTNLAYDPLNRLTSVTDALDGVIDYQYDAVGNLTSITDEENRTTNFTYDALNRQTAITDPLNYTTSTTYDGVGNLTSITDANNNTTNFIYDALNRQTAITNALGDTIETKYDAVGNLIAITDELGRTTEFGYDERNLPTYITDALGNVTTTEYDEAGNLINLTDARNNTTSYEYDKLYRLIKEIDANNESVSYQYDGVGNLLGFTDELNRTTTYGYDALNRQISLTDPLEHITTTKYDEVGNLISVTDANNHTTNYGYDALNRLTSVTNALGNKITNKYDKVGNVTSITDELNRTTTFTYDQRNFQTSITDPLEHTSSTSYDGVGNVIDLTDPLNHTTTYAYDELYRLTSQTDAENRTTTYTYDPASNLLSITDPEQNTTSYTYDELNRLLTDTNQLGNTRSYKYDSVSNQISSVDRNGREINYTYDNLNRNTAEIWLDKNGNPVRTFNYQYDAASQLINASDPDSAYSYSYDLDGRLTSVDNAGTNGVPNVVFNYTYDPVDNLTTVTDSIDGVNKGVETFAYDELDRVTSITQSGDGVSEKRVDYTYDEASQMSQVERYQDLAGINKISESNYKFDEAGRLTELTHNSDDEVISAYDWAYDAANRITQATSPDGVSDYNYDQTDQLVDAQYDYQENENYVYDDNGNRTNDGYVTGDNNQLLSNGTYNYEYDAEGNRVKRVEIATGEVTEYSWDYRNRLVDVVSKDADGNVIANSDYTYDVFDRRIAKSVDADGDGVADSVERFVLDGDHIALTFDGDGNQTERFLHGARIDEVIASENADGEVLWALSDHQGSVRVLLDNDGNVVNNITYDAFGNITVESNPDVNFRFSYTGREYDSETGNYYYRTRYYDPAVGQFINEDTIGFAGGDSNLYRYTFNSPLNYTDPSGNEPFTLAAAALLILTVLIADGLSPDGVQAPTLPTDDEGNLLSPEDLKNLGSCNDSPIFDNAQDLDKSLERAGWEVILGGIPGGLKNLPNLLKSLANSSDEIAKLLGKGIDNLLPKDLDSIPVLVDGFFDDAAKQIDNFDDVLTDGLGNLQDAATGLGAAADDLFKPFFESSSSSGSSIPEVVIDKTKYPESAKHIEDSITNGHPQELTIDRSGAKKNRKESLKGHPTVAGKDRDEFPPAMFKEGGSGASVRPIDSSDNRGAGSSMGHQLRKYPNGTKVKIVVK